MESLFPYSDPQPQPPTRNSFPCRVCPLAPRRGAVNPPRRDESKVIGMQLPHSMFGA